ncbi:MULTISPECIES: alpha/beta fold hydrolase [unclassified Novosphingobium]|uniref:thioesterase II family protein n=1 Tax=unclassified Novosphingobium TaxID=2644732 RepID=UPI0025FF2A54|nr:MULTISPECIES: alpha/beta fold hydrolase [unclassified Novosphingobium]HQV04690.1 alpha/beta fold hydrolase [Novosphingobium sp.]
MSGGTPTAIGARTIYLYPFGGGSAASFRSYCRAFPKETARTVPIEIPGRGQRLEEPPPKTIEECAARTVEQLDMNGDYVLHGHCMGALIAFEVVKLIRARGGIAPSLLVASGRNAPHHANAWLFKMADMSDLELFEHLKGIGGIPKGLSFAMSQPALTALRRDQAIFSSYRPDKSRIDVPVLVLAGREDRMTNPEGLADWQLFTSSQYSLDWFDGEHYFLLDQAAAVATAIDRSYSAMASGRHNAQAGGS